MDSETEDEFIAHEEALADARWEVPDHMLLRACQTAYPVCSVFKPWQREAMTDLMNEVRDLLRAQVEGGSG